MIMKKKETHFSVIWRIKENEKGCLLNDLTSL